MANYNKSFNFRNGVQVDNDNYQGAKKIMHWTGEIGKIKIRSIIGE